MELGRRFHKALLLALDLHQGLSRKGTAVPYLGHLMGTSALVMQFGGTEDQAIAGLLHDAAEDAGGRAVLARIRRRFGEQVAAVTAALRSTGQGTEVEEVADELAMVVQEMRRLSA